jgi:hypothetical protein
MTYYAYDRMGKTVPLPDEATMLTLLDSLAVRDPEHPEVSLNHESGWTLSVFGSGLVVLENVETDEGPWNRRLESPQEALALWRQLARGDFTALQSNPWDMGYGV